MSFLDRTSLSTASPVDDRKWLSPAGAYRTASGVTITNDLAMQASCVLLGGRLYGETLGSLPLIIYREEEEGVKKRARDHFLWRPLRKSPNPWQTAMQWRELMTAFAVYWGRGISEIQISRDGRLILRPLHPDWITKTEQMLDSLKLRFTVTEPGKLPRVLLQDEVIRLEGFGTHTFIPSGLLTFARETIGAWIAKGRYGALYFMRGATPSVWLQFPKKIAPESYEKLKQQAEQQYGGWSNHHKPLLVDDGATVKEVSHNAKDSQLIEAMDADVHDFARWFNLDVSFFHPQGQTTTYASAEVFNQRAIDFSFRPWAVRWEQALARDLFPESEEIYVEHLFDGLMRGNMLERAQAWRTWVESGIKTRNEGRRSENLAPLPGLDEPLTPLNMERTTGAPPTTPTPKPLPKPVKKKKAGQRRLLLIAKGAAERVVRKEVAALLDKARKLAANTEAWEAWLGEFYDGHAAQIMETLQLEPAVAREYAASHKGALMLYGIGATDGWMVTAVKELLRLAELSEESNNA